MWVGSFSSRKNPHRSRGSLGYRDIGIRKKFLRFYCLNNEKVQVYLKKCEKKFGKICMDDSVKNQFVEAAPYFVPHYNKLTKGGEDAYYISKDGLSYGIFDGVGGWAQYEIDPANYSRKLAEGCKNVANSITGNKNSSFILTSGFEHAKNTLGSSTACVISINDNVLHGVNVGDSGFAVYRKSNFVIKSTEQQHSFNFPYQLAGGKKIEGDSPEKAEKYILNLEMGDIIIMYTDGLSDNVYDHEIIELLKNIKDNSSLEIAKIISAFAFEKSVNNKKKTPWSDKVGEGQGNKPDDITVLVIKYKPSPSPKL